MLCDDCQERPASVHITKINNNQKTEKHLCDICAQKSGDLSFASNANFAAADFLTGLFNHGVSAPRPRPQTECPGCGMTYGEFSRSGKIGCSECLNTYGQQLRPLLRRIHGTSTHTGKVPKRGGGQLAAKRRLKELKQELELSIRDENYEQAAKLRDEIRTLEQQ